MYGSSVTVTATLATTSGGTSLSGFGISFYVDGGGPYSGFAEGTSVNLIVPFTTGMVCTSCAQAPVTALSPGSHTITAQYAGDATYAATANTLTQTVARSPISLSVSWAGTENSGTLIARVSATNSAAFYGTSPSGTVEFFNGATSLGTAQLNGVAGAPGISIATLTTSVSTASITATYAGDTNFLGTSVSSTETGISLLPRVVLTLSATPTTPKVGQSIEVAIDVTTQNSGATPSGTVELYDGTKLLATFTLAKAWQLSTSVTLGAGLHTLLAMYSGDGEFRASSAVYGVTVSKLAPTLTLTPDAASAVYGQPVTLVAALKSETVSGVDKPSGQVQFYYGYTGGLWGSLSGRTLLGTAALKDGTASLTVSNLGTGSPQLQAVYTGDSNWGTATSAAVAATVAKAGTKTTWKSLDAGASQTKLVASVAAVSPATAVPTGTVKFVGASGGTVLGSATLADGVATATVSTLTPAQAITAVYGGDTNHNTSESAALTPLTVVDAAGYNGRVAPEAIVSIFGAGLAASTFTLESLPAPTTAAGVTVKVTGIDGVSNPASLLLVSATQVNVAIPAATALGNATISLTTDSGTPVSRTLTVTRTAPGLFAANGGGQGPAAAQIVRVVDGVQTTESAVSYDSASKLWVAKPIALGTGTVYLVLPATGIRNRPIGEAVTCTIGGQSLETAYAGSQSEYPGMDQVNVQIPASLKGAGQVNVTLTANGQVSNTVTVAFE